MLAAGPEHEGALRELAESLNLKPHFARQRKDMTDVLVFTAADWEGHVADDGRFYLLDFSRTMPPVRPLPGSDKNAFLFQHFRPQFVRNYPIPLCSDAFSLFVKGTDLEQGLESQTFAFFLVLFFLSEHKREICAASEHLFSVVIPECARDLSAQLDERLRSGLSLLVRFFFSSSFFVVHSLSRIFGLQNAFTVTE